MSPIFWTYDELKHSQRIVYELHNVLRQKGFKHLNIFFSVSDKNESGLFSFTVCT